MARMLEEDAVPSMIKRDEIIAVDSMKPISVQYVLTN